MNILLRSLDHAVHLQNHNNSPTMRELSVFLTSSPSFFNTLATAFCSRGYGVSLRAACVLFSSVLREIPVAASPRLTLIVTEDTPTLCSPDNSLLQVILRSMPNLKRLTLRHPPGVATFPSEIEFLSTRGSFAGRERSSPLQVLQFVNFSFSVDDLENILPSPAFTTSSLQHLILRSVTFTKKQSKFTNFLQVLNRQCPALKNISLKQINIGGVLDFSNNATEINSTLEEFVMIDNFNQQSLAANAKSGGEGNGGNKSKNIIKESGLILSRSLGSMKKVVIIGTHFACPLNTTCSSFPPFLVHLVLSRCGLERQINWKLFPVSLEHLDLSDNKKLCGTISNNNNNLGRLVHLKYLNLRNCSFQGKLGVAGSSSGKILPDSLVFCDLRNNQFCFDFSSTFGYGCGFPSNLRFFAVSGNRLIHGTLDGIHFPSSLQKFLADDCSLQGDVDLVSLTTPKSAAGSDRGENVQQDVLSECKLEVLSLSGNRFHGKLNLIAPSLKHLHKIDVSGNAFQGLILRPNLFHLGHDDYPPNLRTLFVQGNDFFAAENNDRRTFFPFVFSQLPRTLLRFNCSRCKFKQAEGTPAGSLLELDQLPPKLKSLQMTHLDFGGGHSKEILLATKQRSTAKRSNSKKPSFPSPISSNVLELSSVTLPESLQIFDITSVGLNGSVRVNSDLPPNLSVLKLGNNNFDEENSKVDDELTVNQFKIDFFDSDDEEDDANYYCDGEGDEFVKYDDENEYQDCDDDDYFEDDDDGEHEQAGNGDADFEAMMLKMGKNTSESHKTEHEVKPNRSRWTRIGDDAFSASDVDHDNHDGEISDNENEHIPTENDDCVLQEQMEYSRLPLCEITILTQEILDQVEQLQDFEGSYDYFSLSACANPGGQNDNDDDGSNEVGDDDVDADDEGSDDWNF